MVRARMGLEKLYACHPEEFRCSPVVGESQGEILSKSDLYFMYLSLDEWLSWGK